MTSPDNKQHRDLCGAPSAAETYYKVLTADGTSPYTHYRWPLPNGAPGDWVSWDGDLVPCESGIHYCKAKHLIHWLGPAIYTFEVHPDATVLHADDKSLTTCGRLVEQMIMWNEQTARLFAADCAEHVLPVYEHRYPKDGRPRNAIAAARAFARGEIDVAAWAAAGDAAGDAAWAATRDAARAAAWAAAWAVAGDAAWAAARAAAWAAARAVAGDAARAAECDWQTTCLLQYLHGKVEG